MGALPARFRRERLLIIGCGDVGLRAARELRRSRMASQGVRVLAVTRSEGRCTAMRQLGIEPLVGDLDQPLTMRRLAGIATRVLHLAPPANNGVQDKRSEALLRILRLRSKPVSLVYASTSGVYGDCQGARISESRPVAPTTARAQRRVNAERLMRFIGRSGIRASILRIPGIYAPDREGGTPQARLLRGTAVLQAQDDVFTSHIHADDLVRACIAALWHGKAQRIYHASDDTELRMGDYFDLAADLYGLQRPPRISRAAAQELIPANLLSFMSESRRLSNQRLKLELKVKLRYPTVEQGLRSLSS